MTDGCSEWAIELAEKVLALHAIGFSHRFGLFMEMSLPDLCDAVHRVEVATAPDSRRDIGGMGRPGSACPGGHRAGA